MRFCFIATASQKLPQNSGKFGVCLSSHMTISNIVIFMSDHAVYMCENEKEIVLKAFQLKSTVNLQSVDSILTLLTLFLYSLVSFLESVKSRGRHPIYHTGSSVL